MKKYFNILLLLIVLLIPLKVKAVVSPTRNFYINDYANILSSDTEQYIYEKSEILDRTDGTQIVVVTVNNLEGMSLESYANELFNKWGIGSSRDNGLLLLLALEERMFRVEVGYGLEGILPDSKTGRFQDNYMIPYFKNNNWDDGIKNGYDAFYQEIVRLKNLNLDYNAPISTNTSTSYYFPFLAMFCFFGGFIVAYTIFMKLKFKVPEAFILLMVVGFPFYGIYLSMIAKNSYLFMFLLGTYVGIFASIGASYNSSGSGGRYSSSGFHSSGRSHSSSSGHSGGGGRSGGGGSSRHF